MLHYIANLQANNIAVYSGSSMPFRPNPDHTAGDPLADLLYALAQQDDVRMVGLCGKPEDHVGMTFLVEFCIRADVMS